MQTLISAFIQLGVDVSLFYQMGIILAFMILARFVFVDKWSEIIVKRETETSKKKHDSEHMKLQSERLIHQYDQVMGDFKKKMAHEFHDKRKVFELGESKEYHTFEMELHEHIKMSHHENIRTYEKRKQEIWPQLEEMSEELVKKILQDGS